MTEEEEPRWFRVVSPRKSNSTDISVNRLKTLCSNISRYLLGAERLERAKTCHPSNTVSGLFFGSADGKLAEKLRESRAEIIPLEHQDSTIVINNGAGQVLDVQLHAEYDLALGIIKKFMETPGFELGDDYSDEEANIIGSAMEMK